MVRKRPVSPGQRLKVQTGMEDFLSPGGTSLHHPALDYHFS